MREAGSTVTELWVTIILFQLGALSLELKHKSDTLLIVQPTVALNPNMQGGANSC